MPQAWRDRVDPGRSRGVRRGPNRRRLATFVRRGQEPRLALLIRGGVLCSISDFEGIIR